MLSDSMLFSVFLIILHNEFEHQFKINFFNKERKRKEKQKEGREVSLKKNIHRD